VVLLLAKIDTPPEARLKHALDKAQLEGGLIGKFFGVGNNVPRNVGALAAFVLILVIAALSITSIIIGSDSLWTNVQPLIAVVTLCFGYLFATKG
jgi:hypothetical protein